MNQDQQRAYDQAQLLIAFSEGKKVEWYNPNCDRWEELSGMDLATFRCRIKPEPPMEIEVWFRRDGSYEGPCNLDHHSIIWKMELGWTRKKFREVIEE